MLTAITVKNALCPPDKPRARFADAGGLYLEVAAGNTSRRFFWKYRYAGKEKRLAIGAYPAVGLKDAREARDQARAQLRKGIDPTAARVAEKARNIAATENTFEQVARAYHETKKSGWSDTYAERWLSAMTRKAFPYIGARPIADIKAPELLRVLKRVEDAGAKEIAHSLRQWCGQTFRHGIAQGFCERDVAHDLRDALKPVDTEHFAAVTNPKDLKVLLDAIDAAKGEPTTRAMLKIAALVGQRPFNIRALEWAHVDLDAGAWVIPSVSMKLIKREKRKASNNHYVPLCRQAVEILRDIRPITGHRRFVFPGSVDKAKPASEATMNAALKRNGIPADMHVPHGFRSTLLTMGVEQCGLDPAVLNAALAHGVDDPLGDTYLRARFIDPRREALQKWADYLDMVRAGGNVVPLASKRKG